MSEYSEHIDRVLYPVLRYLPVMTPNELVFILNGAMTPDEEMKEEWEHRLHLLRAQRQVLMDKIREAHAKQR